jgi:hypothetical protein
METAAEEQTPSTRASSRILLLSSQTSLKANKGGNLFQVLAAE